jgi:hypothetical protein
MDDRLKEAEKIIKDMEQDSSLSKVEELIKDNRITFTYKENKYRVRLLNSAEKDELDLLRRKKFGQLLKDKDILFEKDILNQYKERGLNVFEETDIEIKKLDSVLMDLELKLGESISRNEPEQTLKNYKDKVQEIINKKKILFTQRNLLLEFSFENAILNYVAQIITYLSLEIVRDGIWKRMFNSFEDFQKYEDCELINRAGEYSMLLQ